MPHGIFQRLSGQKGRVTIPALGAHIGTMNEWELRRRGDDDDPRAGSYDLRAVFSYINPHLFHDADYEKDVVIEMGRGRQHLQLRVHMVDAEATVLRDRTLLMKGVKISEYSDEAQAGRAASA
jgi:hypothetical protein